MSEQIIIDNRETQLINLMNEKNIKFIKKTLEIGDIIIQTKDNNILYIIERKTLNDLAASIIDKRYHSQRIRIREYCEKNNFPSSNIIYIIEGNIEDYSNKTISIKTLETTKIKLQLRDNFKIINSENLENTIEIIDKIIKINDENNIKGGENNKILTIDSLKNHTKKSKLTPENCYLAQLCMIPGISPRLAENFTKKWSKMQEFYEEINKISNKKEKIKKIIEIDGIGKKIAENILLFMFVE